MSDLMMYHLCGAGFSVLCKAFFCGYKFLLSEQRRYGQHRCVTLLYRIPMGSFDCVMSRPITVVQVAFGSIRFLRGRSSTCHRFICIATIYNAPKPISFKH